jgi:hypothetical protein
LTWRYDEFGKWLGRDGPKRYSPAAMSTTSTLIQEMTLGPLTAAQRSEIMRHAPGLSIEARQLFRRLLIVAQDRGLDSDVIARAAAQARAHFE